MLSSAFSFPFGFPIQPLYTPLNYYFMMDNFLPFSNFWLNSSLLQIHNSRQMNTQLQDRNQIIENPKSLNRNWDNMKKINPKSKKIKRRKNYKLSLVQHKNMFRNFERNIFKYALRDSKSLRNKFINEQEYEDFRSFTKKQVNDIANNHSFLNMIVPSGSDTMRILKFKKLLKVYSQEFLTKKSQQFQDQREKKAFRLWQSTAPID